MKPSLLAALFALAAPPALAQTPAPATPPTPKPQAMAELLDMPHCVWGKFLPIERTLLVSATDPLSDRAWSGATDTLESRVIELGLECAPAMRFDPRTAAEIMELGLHREAFADLIRRDLNIDRTKLDDAIVASPASLKQALRRTAEQMEAGGPGAQPPSMAPIFTALGQPTFEGAPPNKTSAWISLYVMLTVQMAVTAEKYKPV